jgi:hypothetical protein
MKFSKNSFGFRVFCVALSFLAMLSVLPAGAQSAATDAFAAPRSIVLTPPRILDGGSAVFTNGPIDISGYEGTAVIDITSVTNAGGALTASFYTSSDQTNIVAVTNFAAITGTTLSKYTNALWSAVYATNLWLLPGTLTTPTAATAGYSTTVLDPTTVPFTNSTTLTITSKGVYRVGVRARDQRRYFYIVYTPTGSSSNDIVSAVWTGYRTGEAATSQ